MQESRLWLLNHIGNAFTINTNQNKFVQLKNTWDDAVTVKRVSATDSCAWAIGHDHRVYIYVFSSDVPIRVPDTTFENQRWSPVHGFSRKGLIPTDRCAWSNENGIGDRPKESVRLPSAHWQWEGNWFIDENLRGEVVGIEGWQYAFDFPTVYSPEKHWNSFVRKRKWIRFRRFVATDVWARISDMEVVDKAECFIDTSVGGFLMPTKVPGTLSVWAVTNNGHVYVRVGVNRDNPEGDSWDEIRLDKQYGVVNISVGVSNLVWAVTWDGHALARMNVSRNNIYGTSWELVEYPNENTRLMQVAVGHNAVWALSREGTVWFRKGTMGDDFYGDQKGAKGSMWAKMYGEMIHIAVSANDQVFAIDKNTREIMFRTSVTQSELTGKTWQTLSLHEDLSHLEREGRLSAGTVCSCSEDDDSLYEYHRCYHRTSSFVRSSSGSINQLNVEETTDNIFIPQTESSDNDTQVADTSVISDSQTPSNSSVPLAPIIDLPHVRESAQSQSESCGDRISSRANNDFHSDSLTSSPNQTQSLDSKTIQAVDQKSESDTLSDDTTNSINYSSEHDNSPMKHEVAKESLSASECDKTGIDRRKEPHSKIHSKGEKKSHRKSDNQKSQDCSSSGIVFQEKKHKHKHRVNNKNQDDEGPTSMDSQISYDGPPSLTSIDSVVTETNKEEVNIILQEHSAETKVETASTFGFAQQDNSLVTTTPIQSSHPSNTKSNLCPDGNDGVMDALDFILSPSKEKEVILSTKEKPKPVTAQIDLLEPKASNFSPNPTPKTAYAKHSTFILTSSDSSDSDHVSDKIIDFVTDLMSDEEDQDVSSTKNTVASDKGIDALQGFKDSNKEIPSSQVSQNMSVTLEYLAGIINSDSQENQSSALINPRSVGSVRNVNSPSSHIEEIPQQSALSLSQCHRSPSVGVDSTCSDSGSATAIPLYTLGVAQPRLSWRWLDVTSCLIENPSTVPWLVTDSQASNANSKRPIKISLPLRNEILENLRSRNNREIQPFLHIEQAIEKQTWVKRTKMHVFLYGHHNRWMSCSVELEQGISNVKEGCLTVQYCHRNHQKHIQIIHDEIICVKMSSNRDDQSTFYIFATITDTIFQPLMLRAASEEEAHEWVGYLCLANAHMRNVDCPIPSGVAWSCTTTGDVFVSIDSPNTKMGSDLRWSQHGGHMSQIETGPSGVTWAIGFDGMPYVYNGGYGGAVNVDTIGMSDNLQEITDFDKVYVYENQKWFPVVGWCNKGVLYHDFHWMTPSGKSVASKNDITLPASKWQWMSEWTVDFNSPGGVNSKGWQYSTNLSGHFHSHQNLKDYYRRRRWSRTCRLTTQGPWQNGGSLKLLDISVQLDPLSSNTDSIILWAVGANGDVLCRNGVTTSCPEGDSWNHVATYLDKPYRSISIGGSYRVWGIASDGSAWYRSGVSEINHSGKCWLQVVPTPPGNSLLKQVSAGASTVWAVDTKDGLWRRENITPTFPEGTGWDFVASRVKRVSVGCEDQVWIVAGSGFSRYKHGTGVIYKRVGISQRRPSGTDWDAIIGCGWSQVCVRGMSSSQKSGNTDKMP